MSQTEAMTMPAPDVGDCRQLAELSVAELADARRLRKAAEARRDAATAGARARLEEAEAPFKAELDAAWAAETELVGAATETLVDFDRARRAELLAGRECAQVVCPDGVRVDWKEKLEIADPGKLPLVYQTIAPKTAEIRKALKKGETVKGVVVGVAPVVVVGADE